MSLSHKSCPQWLSFIIKVKAFLYEYTSKRKLKRLFENNRAALISQYFHHFDWKECFIVFWFNYLMIIVSPLSELTHLLYEVKMIRGLFTVKKCEIFSTVLTLTGLNRVEKKNLIVFVLDVAVKHDLTLMNYSKSNWSFFPFLQFPSNF